MQLQTQMLIFFGGFLIIAGGLLLLFRDDVKRFLQKTTYQPSKDAASFIPTASLTKRVYMSDQVFQELELTCSAKTHRESLDGVKELLELSKSYDPQTEQETKEGLDTSVG